MRLLAVMLLVLVKHVDMIEKVLDTGEAITNILREGIEQANTEPRDELEIYYEYDFIVVGAGSAGCVVANRLSEVPDWKVLLIEAGPEENYVTGIPILVNYLQFSNLNWKYKTEPSDTACLGHTNRQCNWPRGKVMGGSSVLNYMIYTRGHWRDYDNWERMGNVGWGYEDVLPYFKKSEDNNIKGLPVDAEYHSKGGYLSVSNIPYRSKLATAFLESGVEKGYKVLDYNGENQVGFSYLQVTMKNGTRWSSSRAFLHPIRHRTNLHVKKSSRVTKILIDPRTKVAQGVEFINNHRTYRVGALREVILCAGALNSPQLLMLSGIGPKEHLESLDIPVIKDLKVGYNLMDHIALGGVVFVCNESSFRTYDLIANPSNYIDYFSRQDGPFSVPGGCEALAFFDLKHPNDANGFPDIEILFQGGSVVSDPTLRRNFAINDTLFDEVYTEIEKEQTWMPLPMLLRPKSKGRIMLRGKNPKLSPLIYPNYYTVKEDLDTMVAGIKMAIDLSKTEAMKKVGSKIHDKKLPACDQFEFGSDEYWGCAARQLTFTIYHYTGTCKMAPASDPTAVVDPRLRVHGVKYLRVIDASIMPIIPSCHTNAPTYMVAEKGSDMIKEDWGRQEYTGTYRNIY